MTKFESHLVAYAQVLKAEFDRTRASLSDSDVKGSQNEGIIAEFVRAHVPAWQVRTNCQAVDSFDVASDELDVCVCNEHQAFSSASGGLLIAEGIDAVIQAKASLNGCELQRIQKNCAKVKALVRRFAQGDQVMSPLGMSSEDLDRIPYIVFAFELGLKAESIRERLEEAAVDTPPPEQPDAMFVLNPGVSFINCRSGIGWSFSTGPIQGWLRIDSGERTLVELLRFLNTRVPRFQRPTSPLSHYFPTTLPYPVKGRGGSST